MKSNDPEIPTAADGQRALAANLRERAKLVGQFGAPLLQTFDKPTFRELQAQERSQADTIAEFAALNVFGVNTRDRLKNETALALEGGAMYLVRRIHPEWMRVAHDQAVETLLRSEDTRGAFVGLTPAEARLRAHWLVVLAHSALIGVLENERPVTPEVYLTLTAAAVEAGAR